jgi:hypothetical protein
MRETERRVQEEEEHHRQQQVAIEQDIQRLIAIDERMTIIRDSLSAINKFQQNALLDRQSREEKQLKTQTQSREIKIKEEQRTLTEQLQKNQKSRLAALKATQAAALQRLDITHQREESELILKLQRLLKRYSDNLDSNNGHKNNNGRNQDSNKSKIKKIEERERSLLRNLWEMQEREQEVMSREHELALKDQEQTASLELRGLRSGLRHQRERGAEENRDDIRALAETFSAERTWFDKAIAKRQELADRYSAELISGHRTLDAPPQDLPVVQFDNQTMVIFDESRI